MMDRIRNHRQAQRSARAIAEAMRTAPSAALRRELLEITSRSA